jgi:hypothetical protein
MKTEIITIAVCITIVILVMVLSKTPSDRIEKITEFFKVLLRKK